LKFRQLPEEIGYRKKVKILCSYRQREPKLTDKNWVHVSLKLCWQ